MNKAEMPEWLKLEIKKTKPLSPNLSPINTYRIASKEIWEIVSKPKNLIKIPEVKALIEAASEYESYNYSGLDTPLTKALKPFEKEGE